MKEVQSLVDLSDDDLLERLGRELWSQAGHATPATRQTLRLQAREWLTANLPRAKDAVCGNPVVGAIRDKADMVTLAGAIADIFAKSVGFPVPSVVAILVLRIGLSKLCADWRPKEA
jgi:hypothetical protein